MANGEGKERQGAALAQLSPSSSLTRLRIREFNRRDRRRIRLSPAC